MPNPFKGVPAVQGTAFYTANTLSRYQLNRPFPRFSDNLLQQGRNDSNIWYNSLQVNYNMRFARGITLLANYTLSKMVERWGFTDPFNNVQQEGCISTTVRTCSRRRSFTTCRSARARDFSSALRA
jgi:hypothetical protein